MAKKDIVSKQVIKHLTVDLAHYLLNLDIDPDRLELLQTEQQRIEDRRADLVALAVDRATAGEFILHIEIQNDNQAEMPLRMLRYYTDIRLGYPGYELRQFLVYIGKPALTMAAGIDEPTHQYRYRLIDMHNVDCEGLLEQDSADALVLAILCDFKGKPPQQVVNYILSRLRALTGEDEQGFRRYLDMLEVLSDNRDLRAHIKEAETMLTQIDITRMPSYEIGLEKGIEKGIEKGREKGRAEGAKLGAAAERLRLARELLGLLDDTVIATRFGLSLDEVRALHESDEDDN